MAGTTQKRYIVNPNTGRKILYNGKVYKSLYTINPKTKRRILINGTTYRQLYPAVDPVLQEASKELERLIRTDEIAELRQKAREATTRAETNKRNNNNIVINALLRKNEYQDILNFVVCDKTV